jgi:hypothetical protein
MTFKQLKNQIKEEQKQAAKEIRELKSKRKEVSCGYVSGLDRKRFDYRHKHIAYCQFFFKTPYGMIEQKCHENPIQSIIDGYIREWTTQCIELDQEDFEFEDVRNCA